VGRYIYLLAKGLKTTVVVIDELPTTPETLWLRLMGKGRTQEAAIAELLEMPESDPKRSNALNLLVSWRINMEVTNQVESEEQRILMALSQTYLEWEKQTERRGLEQGREQGRELERRTILLNLMEARYGAIDSVLEAIIPDLLELKSEEWTRLVSQLSKEDLIQHLNRSA
jgi:flagellar biosynthesis/type III secretory pathway protein FliH